MAAKARGLGLDVIVFDPFIEIDKAQDRVRQVELGALLATARFHFRLHTPLSDSSRHIINAAALDRMKSQAPISSIPRAGNLLRKHALLARSA